MYRTAVVTVFLSALAIIAADLVLRLLRRDPAPGRTHGSRDHEGAVPANPSVILRWVRIAVNTVALTSLAAIATTGFSALLEKDRQLTGERLIWHVACAPAFALGAVAVTLFWAHRNRFAPADWSRLKPDAWALPLRKFFFWAAAVLTVPTMVSILLAMLPLAGTGDQQNLVLIHRCSAPLLAAAGLLFAYFALIAWRERSLE
jgi:hypothetical protein